MIVTPKSAALSAPTAISTAKVAAQRFEAVFLREMIATMRKGKLADDLFGSAASDNFREMADAQTADTLARTGAFGIAALVERQLGTAK